MDLYHAGGENSQKGGKPDNVSPLIQYLLGSNSAEKQDKDVDMQEPTIPYCLLGQYLPY